MLVKNVKLNFHKKTEKKKDSRVNSIKKWVADYILWLPSLVTKHISLCFFFVYKFNKHVICELKSNRLN